jgi:DNA-binding LacI/PurR family transcriptional regulator
MSATLRDVAKLAGVSLATASRALHGDYPVSQEKQERIWEAVRQLHYEPNDAAQRLAEGQRLVKRVDSQVRQTYSIGLILNLGGTKVFADPFWSPVLEGVRQELVRQHYHLRFAFTLADFAQSRQRRLLSRMHIDGLIVFGEPYPNSEIGPERTVMVPTSHAMALTPAPHRVDVVMHECRWAMTQMVDHLVGLGHRRFSFVGPVLDPGERRLAFLQALATRGFQVAPDLLIETSWSAEEAYTRARAFISRGTVPDVFVCANDGIAIGVMRAAKESGLRLPNDLAVTGFDDIAFARDVDPPLTTVHVPKELLGEVVVRKLIERIDRPDLPPLIQVIPTTLVIRASCGALERGRSAETGVTTTP